MLLIRLLLEWAITDFPNLEVIWCLLVVSLCRENYYCYYFKYEIWL